MDPHAVEIDGRLTGGMLPQRSLKRELNRPVADSREGIASTRWNNSCRYHLGRGSLVFGDGGDPGGSGMHRMTWAIAILFSVLWFSSAIPIQVAAVAPQAAIALDDVLVRDAPSTKSRVVNDLDLDDVFPVVGEVQGEEVSEGNGVWLKTEAGHYVYSGLAKFQQSGSSYIDVDRRTHSALAVENGSIVYDAPVVLGRPGW